MKLSNRMIRLEFWQDPDVLAWPPLQKLLFIGLLQLADDSGCLEHRPAAFKALLFPLTEEVSVADIEACLARLAQDGKLVPYRAEGKDCLFIRRFHRHQHLHHPGRPSTPLPAWMRYTPNANARAGGRYTVLPPYGDGVLPEEEWNRTQQEQEREIEKEQERESSTVTVQSLYSGDGGGGGDVIVQDDEGTEPEPEDAGAYRMPVGAHQGKPLRQVPEAYLRWARDNLAAAGVAEAIDRYLRAQPVAPGRASSAVTIGNTTYHHISGEERAALAAEHALKLGKWQHRREHAGSAAYDHGASGP